MPQLETVHVKATLSNVALAYFQSAGVFIADIVSPNVRVNKQADYYYEFGKENFNIVDAKRRPTTTPVEVEHTVSTDKFYCEEDALREAVADEEREGADNPIEPEADATRYTSERLRLIREYAVASLLTTAGNYQSGFKATLTGDDQWDEYTSSDPIGDIQTGIDAVNAQGAPANTLWMGYQVWSKLKHHPDFLNRLPGNKVQVVTPDFLKNIWEEIETVAIGRALYNTAVEGQDTDLGYVWGKYCGICHLNRTMPNKKVPSFNYTFVWPYKVAQGRVKRTDQPGSATGVVYQARVYRHADEGARADWVEVAMRTDLKITGAYLGYLISDAVG
jgi:hypothetical protein